MASLSPCIITCLDKALQLLDTAYESELRLYEALKKMPSTDIKMNSRIVHTKHKLAAIEAIVDSDNPSMSLLVGRSALIAGNLMEIIATSMDHLKEYPMLISHGRILHVGCPTNHRDPSFSVSSR
jgi:hypothetical protein